MTATDADVRLLRQHLLAIRQRVTADLDALDQELASMLDGQESFQNVTDWREFLSRRVRASK